MIKNMQVKAASLPPAIVGLKDQAVGNGHVLPIKLLPTLTSCETDKKEANRIRRRQRKERKWARRTKVPKAVPIQ